MMSKKIILFLFLFFVIISGLSAQVEQASDDKADASDQQISGFSLAGYGEKGKKSWDITGKTADIYDTEVRLTDIIGKLYGATDDIKLTADKGTFDKKEGKMHLQDNVVITSTSGARLTTNSLDWDRKKEMVSTADLVNIYKDNMVTTSKGAVGHPNLNQVTLQKDVTVEMTLNAMEKDKPEDKGKVIITCDGPVEIDYQKNVATFKNNVKVDKQEFVLYGDTLDVYFLTGPAAKAVEAKPVPEKPEKKAKNDSATGFGMSSSKLEKIVAEGHVKIVRGDNVSYCEKATYTGADRKIILSGQPKLIIMSTEGLSASIGN
ncbi:MAG: LPS export ABC transporter periplasmic protein LptC [Candidatus Omnitrophica bacterium]|nr:LPS export ABC transporter periplasmic protein LptC [Candidatus Omnitrophota bacterium]